MTWNQDVARARIAAGKEAQAEVERQYRESYPALRAWHGDMERRSRGLQWGTWAERIAAGVGYLIVGSSVGLAFALAVLYYLGIVR